MKADQQVSGILTEKILRIAQVSGQTGLSRASIYKQMRLGRFPKAVKLTARSSGWAESAVQGWIKDRISQQSGGFESDQDDEA